MIDSGSDVDSVSVETVGTCVLVSGVAWEVSLMMIDSGDSCGVSDIVLDSSNSVTVLVWMFSLSD